MKKQILFLSIIVVILAIILAIIFYPKEKQIDSSIQAQQNSLSNKRILEIIKPEIENYCATLESNFKNSGCAVCNFKKEIDDETQYTFMDNETYFYKNPGYNVTTSGSYSVFIKKDNGYDVFIKIPLAYGGYNNRPSSEELTFVIDNEGRIISKNMPIKEC